MSSKEPAPCGSAEVHDEHYFPPSPRKSHDERPYRYCPGIAAHQSAEAWELTEQQSLAIHEARARRFSVEMECVEAAVRLGIVAPVEDNCLECGGFPSGGCVDHNCSRHTGNTGLGRCELCPAPEGGAS